MSGFNGILIIDKPAGKSSHGVVSFLRRTLGERRIGHGGTLDPMATGVLPIFVGRATRAADFCASADKEYIARFRLGIVTDTQDITGSVVASNPVGVSEHEVREIMHEFTGELEQLPPMYSAVKIGGQKLYQLARRGIEAERQPRRINIYSLELTGRDGNEYEIKVNCSKGTYVRTLCNDIGARLGCGAAMTALRRTRAGRFGIEQAHTPEQVAQAVQNEALDSLFIPVDSLFEQYPSLCLPPDLERRCRNGAQFPITAPDGLYRVYGADGLFLMLGEARGGTVKTIKSFFEVR